MKASKSRIFFSSKIRIYFTMFSQVHWVHKMFKWNDDPLLNKRLLVSISFPYLHSSETRLSNFWILFLLIKNYTLKAKLLIVKVMCENLFNTSISLETFLITFSIRGKQVINFVWGWLFLVFFFHFWGWDFHNLFLFPPLNLAMQQRRMSDWVQ